MFGIDTRAILAALERILYVLLSLLGVAEALGLKLDKTATESTPLRIQGQVDWIGQQLTGEPWSLSVLHTQLSTIIAALDGINAPVLAAIAALPAGSDIVIPSAADNASQVWLASDPNSLPSRSYGDEIWEPFRLAKESAVHGMHRSGTAPGFGYYDTDNPSDIMRLNVWPTPDWSAILPADTRLSWLTRTDTSGLTWSQDASAGYPIGFDDTPPYPVPSWFPLFSEADFDALKGAKLAVPPVWPGEPNVLEGTPVALGADVTIPGPLDGVRIALTTPPSGLSNFTMGGQTWYYRAGQIAFVSDVGDVETWQYITWTNALYCPRQMARAASAILRGLAGVEGTATPWVTA